MSSNNKAWVSRYSEPVEAIRWIFQDPEPVETDELSGIICQVLLLLDSLALSLRGSRLGPLKLRLGLTTLSVGLDFPLLSSIFLNVLLRCMCFEKWVCVQTFTRRRTLPQFEENIMPALHDWVPFPRSNKVVEESFPSYRCLVK